MLEIKNVTRTFGTKHAVDDVSITIDRGSFVGIIGRSGAGKSTLLRMVNRLQDVSSGSIVWDGQDVTGLKGKALRDWRASCAMVFQQFNIVGRLDVMTNVLMGRLNHTTQVRSLLKLWTPQDRAIAVSALEQFDMTAMAGQRAESLSGGQQQRVAIARALVQEPEIVLADEPIASLDPRNTKIVMDSLQRLNMQFGITVLCNLHDLDIAKDYCGRLIGMAQGKVVFDGAPEDLTESVARELYGLEANEVMTVLPPVAAPVPHLEPVAA
ncbi:MAG: phosphonate ABC transporter ATP-binding protein [Beijerinckiaceae bacterium]